MNLILAFLIYIFILFIYGEEYLPSKEVKYGITCNSLGYEIGLKDGDKILKLDGKEAENFFAIPADLLLNKTKIITIERDNKIVDIPVDENIITKMIHSKSFDFISPRFPIIISDFSKESPAKESGLKIGDTLICVNNVKTTYFNEFRKELNANIDSNITITALRKEDTIYAKMIVPTSGLIGISLTDISKIFTLKKKTYSFFEAIPAGIKLTYNKTVDYLKQLKLIFSPKTKAYESLGGFITIGNLFPGQWDWLSFWSMTAFISIILAIMNLLPIPALDGGHVLFLLWELITGRKPNEKFIEYAQMTGMILLLLLVIYANGNDIFRLFGK